jgi:hypothetical protein
MARRSRSRERWKGDGVAVKADIHAFAWRYDPESRTTTILDRAHRPLVRLPGKWPRVDHAAAVPCDISEPKCYGTASKTFYRATDHNAARCDPALSKRLSDLVQSIPAQLSHADLVSLTFNASTN